MYEYWDFSMRFQDVADPGISREGGMANGLLDYNFFLKIPLFT